MKRNESPTPEPGETALADLPAGACGVVRRLEGGRTFAGRMAGLGFTVGARVRVMQNYRPGPLLALIRETRVALGRGEALRVVVSVCDDD